MLKNFFRTAGRIILKHKAFAIINFIGLTCGLSLALLITAYVRSEIYHQFVMIIVVVALTIGYQVVKASLANPVKSLRSE
jgi:hypothetical protein